MATNKNKAVNIKTGKLLAIVTYIGNLSCIFALFIIEYGSYSIVGIDQVSYGFRQKCALV